MLSKKGISPLIATVLLIGFTIVLAALVIRWGSELFSSQIKTQTCDNEATIICTSDVDLGISTVVFDNIPDTGDEKLQIGLVSNGKQNIDKGFIVRIHKIDGTVIAAESTGILNQYETLTLQVDPTDFEPDLLLADAQDAKDNCPTDKFCGISVIPKIKHTTDKGDSCDVTCGQSEKRSAITSIVLT
ncbi:hypothetical protein J4471_05260 [Candidatus Woesearchaeota archaeon]|nr:hypothetical protein [Candidatus Woesearchaeota archaeon]